MSVSPIEVRRLSRSYGSTPVLDNIDFEARHGEFVAIVGPSGCGKSTLLNLLSGHDAPTSGTVARNGLVRMVYQQDGLFPWMTVAENISLGLPRGADVAARLPDLISAIQLQGFEDHYPHQLSGGMRQRVEIARALAGDADILLLDEPFSALDYLTRLRMRAELAAIIARRPRTVVLVTHDIEEAAQLADRVIVLSERPARVRCELTIGLPRPRALTHPAVVGAVHQVLALMGLEPDDEAATSAVPAEKGPR